jgi:hypothetical protein
MKIRLKNSLPFLLTALFLYGCASTSKVEKSSTARKPRITIQVASLDVANLNKRIEQRYVVELTKILKHEQVEVFTVQGLSRYPGIASRTDLVNELSLQTDWRNAFGETLNISGRQTGNAIFSAYPIISQRTVSFEKIIPKSFETALQAVVDAGVHPLAVFSAQLPAQATPEEQLKCLNLLSELNSGNTSPSIILAGNLPASEKVRRASFFTEVPSPQLAKSSIPKIWYSTNPFFQLLNSRTIETELGTIVIAQFGLY